MPNRIREIRLAAGLTLDQVAVGAGTTFQTISRLETGKRRLTDAWMRRVARPLGVAPSALLADEAPDQREFVKNQEEAALLRFWRLLELRDKRIIAAFAREKGLEILSNKPQRRRA